MTSDEFCSLAARLREMGALKVKAGDLEVVFQPSVAIRQPVQAPQQSAKEQRKRPLKPEEALLEQFRAELEGN